MDFAFTSEINWPSADPKASDYSLVKAHGPRAIVIDNGSTCRAGWAGEDDVRMAFPNIISRPRNEKISTAEVTLGNSISYEQYTRESIKGPLEQGVVIDLDSQEIVFDHIFETFGITDERILYPLVLTEPLCCPNTSRKGLSELLFETYDVPSVAYGIDGLFSHYQNRPSAAKANGLVVSVGYYASLVLPVVNGRLDAQHARRLNNLGGYKLLETMSKLLHVRHPRLHSLMNYVHTKELIEQHTHFSESYLQELKLWEQPPYMQNRTRRLQLPFNSITPTTQTSVKESPEEHEERRNTNIRRLQDIHHKRRLEKLEGLVQRRTVVKQLLTTALATNAADKEDQDQDAAFDVDPQTQELMREAQKIDFDIFQINSKNEAMERQRNEMSHQPAKRPRLADDDLRKEDPLRWLQMIKEDQAKLLERNRFEIDGFEERAERVDAIDNLLALHEQNILDTIENARIDKLKRQHQLIIGTEQIQVPEVLFEPSMLGLADCGLSESIEAILSQYSHDIRKSLAANVFVTGGCVNIPGFTQRITHEVRQITPAHDPVNVYQARDACADAWHGANAWVSDVDDVAGVSITKAQFSEFGGDYLVEHTCSNKYVKPL